ncbi:hypothetical protein [Methylobacterium sp. CM6257]
MTLSPYHELVEAQRRKRVIQVLPGRQSPVEDRIVNDHLSDQRWDIPSYDVRAVAPSLVPKWRELIALAQAYARSGEFQPPHPEFALICQFDGLNSIVKFSAEIDETDQYVFSSLSKHNLVPEGATYLYHAEVYSFIPNINRWVIGNRAMVAPKTFIATSPTILKEFFDDDGRGPVYAHLSGLLLIILLMMHYGSEEVIKYGDLHISDDLKRLNQGRAMANDSTHRGPLPPTQPVIYLTTDPDLLATSPRRQVSPTEEIKRSVAGHERRGHYRRCGKDKVLRWIRATVVNGGSQGLPLTKKVRLL